MGTLTKREDEIMRLLAHGESTKHIAHSLGISPKTVENHRARILEKMHADNPAQISCMLARIDEHLKKQT
jgi:DNA-binding NarL/FixJ family response regulator